MIQVSCINNLWMHLMFLQFKSMTPYFILPQAMSAINRVQAEHCGCPILEGPKAMGQAELGDTQPMAEWGWGRKL